MISKWSLAFSDKAEKWLRKADPQTRKRIFNALNAIKTLEDPRSKGKALTGNYSNFWRYRIGDYRVICDIRDTELVIIAVTIDHRREVYK